MLCHAVSCRWSCECQQGSAAGLLPAVGCSSKGRHHTLLDTRQVSRGVEEGGSGRGGREASTRHPVATAARVSRLRCIPLMFFLDARVAPLTLPPPLSLSLYTPSCCPACPAALLLTSPPPLHPPRATPPPPPAHTHRSGAPLATRWSPAALKPWTLTLPLSAEVPGAQALAVSLGVSVDPWVYKAGRAGAAGLAGVVGGPDARTPGPRVVVLQVVEGGWVWPGGCCCEGPFGGGGPVLKCGHP